MYRKCTTELSARHQRLVEERLLELLAKVPFEDITITQLCREAGISRRIFYHLFSNKTGALHALMDHRILDLASYRADEPSELLRFFCYWRDQKPLLDALKENGMSGLLLERMIGSAMEENQELLQLLQRNGWSDSKEVIIFCVSGLMGLVFRWYDSGFRKPPEEMATLVDELVSSHPLRKIQDS